MIIWSFFLHISTDPSEFSEASYLFECGHFRQSVMTALILGLTLLSILLTFEGIIGL